LATSVLAVSLVEALSGPLQGVDLVPTVKWPNDVVLVDRSGTSVGKVAGILADLVSADPPAVVVGMGVNLGWPGVDDDGPPGATSLGAVGVDLGAEDLLVAVLDAFGGWCGALEGEDEAGVEGLTDAHPRHSSTVGRRVSVDLEGGPLDALAVDVGRDGSLVLEVDGRRIEVRSGDVVHLRTVPGGGPG